MPSGSPIPSNALTIVSPGAAGPCEVLYESSSTRILRLSPRSGGSGVICKEYLGAAGSRRFRQERDLLRRLAGIEGVVQLAPEAYGADVLALRDAGGITLAQALHAGKCDSSVVLRTACQLARALAEVHRAGIIHQDINPANILLCASGQSVLIDFDLAVLATRQVAVDPPGQIFGTLGYMAPEQSGRTGRAVDQRADLYSLGATLYEMAVGRPPFAHVDALQLMHDHLVREPVAPCEVDATVPRCLSDIIVRLLAKAPEQRYENLEQRVEARTRELQETQVELVTTARRAGMAEVANNVLHNVGNVCNSITVSTSTARASVANSKLRRLRRAVDLMNEHEADIGDFMTRDPKGKVWRTYLNELVGALEEERRALLDELDRLMSSVEHANHVLASQQSNAGASRFLEVTRVDELIEEALRMNSDAVARRGIRVVRVYSQTPTAALDKPRLLQILVNLIANAAEAMEATPQDARELTLGIDVVEHPGGGVPGRRLLFTVRDNGDGIAQENLKRIFSHGFTTRAKGHGFGLHSSAVAAVEMDGRLTAQSDGPGLGVVFTLELPFAA